ncbi:MAG: S9 family peptidase [Gemmatimonadetes bacterium]|nr:S9 family peptidase [Gemmatimonadota bacterium]
MSVFLPVRRSFALVAGLGVACAPALKLAKDDSAEVLTRHALDAPDPSAPGTFTVKFLYYGSGSDRNRPEYRDSVTLKTPTVDASKLVDLAQTARERNRYWGFTPAKMPLNARVWYPDGPGPFPLVLVAHGNHNMRDFSDPGYGWIGELLASRGIIVAALDMNFINGGIRNENDARGWFFLKHLAQWREWNTTEGNLFHGRVDLDRIALIGHSRGGEAVGHAAAFNRLTHYPDDANVRFDFDFGIRSIIAIAPVDGQYQPADRLVPVDNVDYLVFHGSHDGDVSSFMGIRQYQRVRFTDGRPHLKAAVFVYRANHGQWNTVWGAHDNGPRSGRILDLRTLMPPEDQRQFGRVYISAFLEATLRDDSRYLALFRDHRTAADWLPKTMYITRFEESTFRTAAAFEEDVDVTTGSLSGIRLEGDSLATWRESRLALRTANSPAEGSSQYNNAVTLGWNNRIAGEDTTRRGRPASFTLHLTATNARELRIGETSSLQFLLMPTEAMPGPRREKRDSTAADSTPAARASDSPRRADDDELPPIDLSIEVVDAAGQTARLPLSDYGVIRRPLETWILMRRDIERSRFARQSEIVLQTWSVPLADFRRATPSLDLAGLRAVRFVFDRAVAGTVILDDIGFATLDPAFVPVATGQR